MMIRVEHVTVRALLKPRALLSFCDSFVISLTILCGVDPWYCCPFLLSVVVFGVARATR